MAAEAGAAGAVRLGAAFPNPNGGTMTVPYQLAAPGPVHVRVYDALGREVAVLAEGLHRAGAHRATLEASALAAGVYIVVLEAGETRAMQRVLVVR